MIAENEINLVAAEQFLAVFNEEKEFSFLLKGEGKALTTMSVLPHHGNFDEIKEELSHANGEGAAIYFTVNETDMKGRLTENVIRVRAVFLDVDEPREFDDLKFPIAPHIVVETSPKCWHAYWLVDSLPLDEFKPIQQAIASALGGDPKVCDLPRVMRVPGFLHQKGEPFVSRIASINLELPRYTRNDLIVGFDIHPAAATEASAPTASMPIDPGAIRAGDRNAALTRLGGSLRRFGCVQEDIEFALQSFNRKNCLPPLSSEEVSGVVSSVMRYPAAISSLADTMTDTGNAERFVGQWHDRLRYVPQLKSWLLWDGSGWQLDKRGHVFEQAKQTALLISAEAEAIREAEAAKAMKKHGRNSLNRRKLIDMIETASTVPRIQIDLKLIDADKMLLGVANGVVNLAGGIFRPIKPDDYVTKRADVEFDETAGCPVFEQFIRRIFGEDDELIAFVQRAMGYTLTGRVDEQCLFFLHGSGANGKSTFLNALRGILGDYAVYTAPETLMPRVGSGASPSSDLARLRGARLVLSNEVEEGAYMAENLVKQVTGGDPIVARYLHKEFFEFEPQLKLWIAGNHLPVVRGNDEGIWRRIKLIPFNVTIPEKERDPDLLRKLRLERAGILNWMIKGCLEWQKLGLHAPTIVTTAVRDYRGDMDIIGQWLEDECVVSKEAFVRAQQLYENYRNWAEQGGYRPMSQNAFSRKIETRGVTKRRTASGRVYEGIALRAILPEDLSLAA
jgi:putative DNA primase/helicase